MSKAEIPRQRIINAAILTLAGEDMFHRIQLDHLAEKAGVSEATVRYHFNSKDKFLLAVWNCIVKEREPYTLEHFYRQNKNCWQRRTDNGNSFMTCWSITASFSAEKEMNASAV